MARTKARDHLGNEYVSVTAMLEAYGIPPSAYYGRIRKGKSLKDALTIPVKTAPGGSKTCYDHLGNKYPSTNAMCRAYGLDSTTFWNRMKMNIPLKEALTTPQKTQDTIGKTCEDHLGNRFDSMTSMLQHYGLPRNIFYTRRKSGWDLEKCLTTPLCNKNGMRSHFYDHKGKEYQTLAMMCNHYGISVAEYGSRIRQGWSLKKVLTTPHTVTTMGKKECVDHLGNHYRSQAAMARAYGVTKDQMRSRIELGWPLEKVLTNPKPIEHKHKVRDPKGKVYKSKKEMYDAYQQNPQTVKRRMEVLGLSYHDAMTVRNIHQKTGCKDHTGQRFHAQQDMMNYWNVGSAFHTKLRRHNLRAALTTISPQKRRIASFGPGITDISRIGRTDYYKVTKDEQEYIWHISIIFEYYRSTMVDISYDDNGYICCTRKTGKSD